MNVIQSFATESASSTRIHDLIKEIAEFLTAKGLKGNFHLTGDFARALRRHARRDVIQALARHEIGYHCNHHGGRPFMAGYGEADPWRDAVATWLAEEMPGIRVLEELFERTPAYHTTEFAKAPQVAYGSWLAGIPSTGILLGQGPDGQTAPLPDAGQGAAWYCNSFVPTGRFLFSPDLNMSDLARKVRRALARLSAELDQSPGGVLRSFTHEYPLAWDTTRPMIGSSYADTHYEDISFEYLRESKIAKNMGQWKRLTGILADYPGTRFIGYTDYLEDVYHPGHGQWLSIRDIDRVANRLIDGLDAVSLERVSVSPAEAAGLLVRALRIHGETGSWPKTVAVRSLIGPTEEPARGVPACSLRTKSLLAGLKDIDRTMDDDSFIPAGIDIGGRMLGPGQWLQCLARLYGRLRAGNGELGEIACPKESLPVIADDAFFRQRVFTRPKLYPEGFTGERICRLCRLQSWSWKPAVLRPAGLVR